MRLEFDDGTLVLYNTPDTVPYAEWDDRINEYRTQAYRYRALLNWAGHSVNRLGVSPEALGLPRL